MLIINNRVRDIFCTTSRAPLISLSPREHLLLAQAARDKTLLDESPERRRVTVIYERTRFSSESRCARVSQAVSNKIPKIKRSDMSSRTFATLRKVERQCDDDDDDHDDHGGGYVKPVRYKPPRSPDDV